MFWFEDQSQANAIGFWRYSLQLKRPALGGAGANSSSRTYRVVIGMHQPIQETVSNNTVSGIAPAPTISYVSRCFVEFVLPERTSLENRKTIRKMMANALAESQTIAIVENLVTPY